MSTTAQQGTGGRAHTADGTEETGRGGERGGRGPLRGLLWLVWRQHRAAFGALCVIVIGGAVWLAVLRGRMAGYLDAHHIAGCSLISLDPRCAGTQSAVADFRGAFAPSLRYAAMGLLLFPAVAGVFLGAPLIARELESGTHKVVLTQSVSPLRWLAAKTALPALAVLAATSALSAVFGWVWQVGGDEVSGTYWYSVLGFNALGPVPVAYALLALAVGTLAGLLLRRTVASMAVTLGVMAVVQNLFLLVRPYLRPTASAVFPNHTSVQLPDGSWPQQQGYVTGSGARLDDNACASFTGDYEACLRDHGVAATYYDNHPVSHHWPLAWTEAGIVLVLAVALTVIVFRVFKRRFG
ncbi:ABC transporter permease [Streptomyces celluloflavus]|uniref:ABC transporter permease n=1 Tax=Streptomyces celluloflavus TaxID=58344 RepID=UPI0036DD235E